MASQTIRDACIRAFLDLLAQRPFERISLSDVAAHAGVALSEMRAEFSTPFDLLDGFMRQTDRQVLSEGTPEDGIDLEEPARERLFEVLMRRLDALEPHRDAVASLARSARRDPRLALALLAGSVRAQRWMLAAAGIDATGLEGDLRARGLAVLFTRLVEVWLKDEDPGLSRTMAHLDEQLRQGARLLGMMEDVATILRFGRPPRRRTAAPAEPAETADLNPPL